MTLTVFFDPGEGTTPTASRTVTYGDTYGSLPAPEWRGRKFSGWFTEPEVGTQITENTTVSATDNQTLYAHWDAGFSDAFVSRNGEVTPLTEAYVVSGGAVSQVVEAYLVTNGEPREL